VDFADILGRFVAAPVETLGKIRARPDARHAALVVLLAAVARFLARALTEGLPEDPRHIAAGIGRVFLLWVAFTSVWHGLSGLFKHPAKFLPFLAHTGWSTAALWIALIAAVPGGIAESARPLSRIGAVAATGLFYFLIWDGLKKHYGWTGGKAFLLLIAPGAAVIAAGLFSAFLLVGGALLSKVF